MIFTLLISSSLFAACFSNNITIKSNQTALNVESRAVINGYQSPSRPFYVWLTVDKGSESVRCGGSIINSYNVLTAAHCTVGAKSIDVKDQNGNHLTHVTSIKRNPGYSTQSGSIWYPNDIAVLKLHTGQSSSKAIPLCTKSYYKSGYYTIIAGMGKTQSQRVSSVLMEGYVYESQSSSCDLYSNVNFNKQICTTGGSKGTQFCYGDSGGPLFTASSHGSPHCLYGIVSFGDEGCPPRGASAYTRVSAYYNWIKSNL